MEPQGVVAIDVMSTRDLIEAIRNLREGNVVVLSFRKLKANDSTRLRTFLMRLIKFAKDNKLGILGLGKNGDSVDYLVLSPKPVRILSSNAKGQ